MLQKKRKKTSELFYKYLLLYMVYNIFIRGCNLHHSLKGLQKDYKRTTCFTSDDKYFFINYKFLMRVYKYGL